MKTDGCVSPKKTRFRVAPTRALSKRISHRIAIGLARFKGPCHLHPPDFELPGVTWYIQTHEFQRTEGHWDKPRYNISLYEVTRDFVQKRKLPVLRRVIWDHGRDFRNVKDRGLFDPTVFDETIARMTRAEAVEFDRMCQATNELLRFAADGFDVSWDSNRHIAVDRRFNEIWSFMDTICSDTRRHLVGWTDGYSKAPDADARAWARSLRR